jgi:hypothetical protein
MDNIIIGTCNVPKIEDDNSANYVVASKAYLDTEINYYPVGLFEFDKLTNQIINKEIKEIAAPNKL